jgi:solute carrier family 25 (mitochondrial carnitine/acylcarnitine transporter), member 20/29
MVSTITLYPLDLVRTKMQSVTVLTIPTNSVSTSSLSTVATAAASKVSALPATPLVASHGGPIQVFQQTIQHGGVRALYTGMAVPLAAQAVYKGTVFTVNNVSEQAILDRRRRRRSRQQSTSTPVQLSYLDRFACGFLGGSVNGALFVTPVEFIRNQMIAHQSRQAMVTSATANVSTISKISPWYVISHHGIRGVSGLWRGISWTIWRDGLGCGAFFAVMAYTQHLLQSRLKDYHPTSNRGNFDNQADVDTKPSLLVTASAGAVAGLAYWVVALPFDTIKTWIQSAEHGSVAVPVHVRIHNIWKESGTTGVVRQLCRGWQVAYGRGIPASAITFSVYSYTYRAIEVCR